MHLHGLGIFQLNKRCLTCLGSGVAHRIGMRRGALLQQLIRGRYIAQIMIRGVRVHHVIAKYS
jgi:hypothetical protein